MEKGNEEKIYEITSHRINQFVMSENGNGNGNGVVKSPLEKINGQANANIVSAIHSYGFVDSRFGRLVEMNRIVS